MELRGKTVLLTGAGGGLGHYIARALAAEGADLVLSDLPAVPLDGLAEELRARGARVETLGADLTDTAGIEAVARHAAEALGPLDVLVNNAGLEFGKSFTEQTRAELEGITSVNLLAVMELTRVVLPGMLERGGGHVVNIASIAGRLCAPYLASYAATKHALVGFTHSLRAEYGPEPVGFTAICPVFISRVGMYGRLESEIGEPPRELATMPPEAVGEAVVEGIRRNRAELLVARPLTRSGTWLYAVAPRLFTRLAHGPRTMDFAKRFVAAKQRAENREGA